MESRLFLKQTKKVKYNDMNFIFYYLYSKKWIAGQEALSVLDEEEEISSLEVGNINGNETMTNSREPSKKSTKKMSVVQKSF